MNHNHESCHPENWVWLPYDYGTDRGFLKEHPYCIKCGAVKNMSPNRSRGIGFYANILGSIARRRKLTDVQIRLIMKKLEEIEGFEDRYSLSGDVQSEWFLDAVEMYTSLPREFIAEYL